MIRNILGNRLFWLGLVTAVPAYFLVQTIRAEYQPRRPQHGGFTLVEVVEREIFERTDKAAFVDDKTVEGHRKKLLDGYDSFWGYAHDVWQNVQFWYKSNTGDLSGNGMLSYKEIVKGKPGSCTEGTFIAYANLSQFTEIPETGEKLKHHVVLITYDRVGEIGGELVELDSPGHCLYVGEVIDAEGTSKFFHIGINPFESPTETNHSTTPLLFDSIVDVIEYNVNHFRRTERGPGENETHLQPQKFVAVRPERLGVSVLDYSPSRVITDSPDKALQRKFMQHFDRHGKDYLEARREQRGP